MFQSFSSALTCADEDAGVLVAEGTDGLGRLGGAVLVEERRVEDDSGSRAAERAALLEAVDVERFGVVVETELGEDGEPRVDLEKDKGVGNVEVLNKGQ